MRFGRTLYGRLSVALLLLFVAVGAFTLVLGLRSAELYRKEVTQQLNHDVAAHIAKSVRPFAGADVDEEALRDLFMDAMMLHPSLEVYLLDGAGKILAFDAPPEHVRRERVDLAPVERFLAGDYAGLLVGDDPRHPTRSKPFVCHPIEADGALRGYLYIILGGEERDSVAAMLRRSHILGQGALFGAVCLLAAALAGVVVFRVLTRPLRRLESAMAAYQHGGPRNALPEGGDDVGRLAATFNRMAGRIDEQYGALRATDQKRRDFLAGISHDLRTPTAAVQALLETMLTKDERIGAEERRAYVERALDHSQRLGRLVDQLFELARLEAGEFEPRKEPFSLAELVQDVGHKYAEPARQRGVQLDVRLAEELPDVHADIGLIERAIDNLIENALRYTPSGGRVVIALERADGGVALRVEDTGSGIPADELPRVFDRFFRGERAHTGVPKGTGLGLAITKRILDLHGSSIDVESEVDEGTRFRFAIATLDARAPQGARGPRDSKGPRGPHEATTVTQS